MFKKVIKTIGKIVLILVMLLLLVTVVGVIFRNEMQLSPWGTGFFVVKSGSMEPAIPVGSIILVNAVSAGSISEGDIIVFFSTNRQETVTHRVVEISDRGGELVFTTRGDANNVNDSPLTYRRIIGRVFFTIPGNNFIVTIFNEASFIGIAIVAIGIALCVYGVLSSFIKSQKSKRIKSKDENSDE